MIKKRREEIAEVVWNTYEIDNETSIRASTSRAAEESLAVREAFDDQKCGCLSKRVVSGVAMRVAQVEDCIVATVARQSGPQREATEKED